MPSDYLAGDYGKLIESWIGHAEHGVRTGGQASNEHFWAYETMADLCRIDPEVAWDIIRSVVDRKDDEGVLAFLGSGPLEDLLSFHGTDFIDRLLAQISHSDKFAKVASSVWKNRIPDDVWHKLQIALTERG